MTIANWGKEQAEAHMRAKPGHAAMGTFDRWTCADCDGIILELTPVPQAKRDDWHCPKCNRITDRSGLPCPTCDGVETCKEPEPFGQSGVPDFCGRRLPCDVHESSEGTKTK